MTIELSDHQREMLTELLEAAHKDKVHELHRTDSLGYKAMLREKISTIEELCAMIAVGEPVA
jgi:hypothetical protein